HTQHFASWDEAIAHCVALHQQGEIARAEEGYAQILLALPDHPEVLRLRGLALTQLDRAAEGLPLLQAARRLAPGHPLVHLHLGYCLQRLGQLDAAADSYAAAARLAPKDGAPWVNLAAVRLEQEDWAAALESAREAVARMPQLPEAQHNLGFALLENHRPEEALEPLQQAVRLQPNFPEAWMHLGRAYADLGRLEAAVSAYRECLRLDPGHTAAAVNLANVWQRRGLDEEAIDLYDQVLKRHPERWEARLSLASALAGLDRLEAAQRILEGVTPPKRLAHKVLLQRVAFLLQAQRPDDARVLLETATERDLGYWSARYGLSTDATEKAEIAERLAEMLAAGEALDFEQRVQTAFLLADHFHRAKAADRAFPYYAQGHAWLRTAEPFHRESWWTEQEREFAAYPELTRRLAALGTELSSGAGGPRPIFIVGMPRSGTSLLEQILDCHSAVRGGGELPYVPRLAHVVASGADDAALASGVAELRGHFTRIAEGAPWVTDKMPHNFQHLGLIAALYPEAPILVCRRDARDNCLSIFQQRFAGQHAYAHDLGDLGRHYRDHEAVIARWQERIPNPLRVVDYESLVDDLEGQLRAILAFLGLPWEDSCLRFYENPRKVRTASREQVTQPLYRSSVGRWQPYAAHLRPLFDALEISA
ncbi:MAG: sulfotransferase, partial [Acidithiobacillus sp.]|uniref:tetratricopeptide repeat-containing sulfotransferase family protein n=1 Tax=Acidithiobacillus sp. TaxID=1872118 RepID=UPI003D08D118